MFLLLKRVIHNLGMILYDTRTLRHPLPATGNEVAHLEISLLQDFRVETKPEEVDSLILRLRK